MAIANPVGTGCPNRRADVRIVQLLLNLNAKAAALTTPLTPDGAWGGGTQGALTQFQTCLGQASGKVAPGDACMNALRQGLPTALTREVFWGIMADASQAVIDRYHAPLLDVLPKHQITTPLRIAHFLAQVGHESADLRYQEELADGAAYEGRADLGNTQPGDGRRFKGRGLIQLTGRANYTAYGKARGEDFLTGDAPKRIAQEPELAIDVACWYWTTRELNKLADADDLRQITRRVNGGFNGLDDRAARLARAKWFLKC